MGRVGQNQRTQSTRGSQVRTGARRDTRLEATAAEFLALGHLLREHIPAYKAHGHNPGYDLVATNPECGRMAKIQVKSRWASDYDGAFPIRNFDSDFVIFVALNCGNCYSGSRNGLDRRDPAFYVIPTAACVRANRRDTFSRVFLRDLARDPERGFLNRWDRIRRFLRLPEPPRQE